MAAAAMASRVRLVAPARSGQPARGQLRVLHAITPSRMAGAETFLARLLLHAADGEIAHRCVVSRGSKVIDEMRAKGVDVEGLGIRGKANVLAPIRLAMAARRMGATLINSHLSSASWWCGWLERFGGPPTVGHVHGFTSRRWHSGQSHLVTCSQAVKRDLMMKKIAADKITVLHLPVDESDLVPTRSRADIRRELGADEQTPIVGTFAHLSPKKGYADLVEAAGLVLRELPTAQFWCFGEGNLREELTARARELGISDRFRLLGYRRDVPDLMRAIDVMALPSHREPFGLVYVEAGLCRRPVIGCQSGGAPEIVEHGESGLLVPARAPDALAKAILTILGNPEQAKQMGDRGYEICRDRFTWEHYLAGLNQVYEMVASRGRSPVAAWQLPIV